MPQWAKGFPVIAEAMVSNGMRQKSKIDTGDIQPAKMVQCCLSHDGPRKKSGPVDHCYLVGVRATNHTWPEKKPALTPMAWRSGPKQSNSGKEAL